MIYKSVVNCQSPHAGGESLNIVDGVPISNFEAQNIKIADLCYADSSFYLYFKDEGTSVFCKYEDDKYICVIYGHLNERDDSGRRIPYCTYTEYQDDIKEVFSEINRVLEKYDYSTNLMAYHSQQELKSSTNLTNSRMKLAIGIIVVAATIAVAGYAIYTTCNNKSNNNGTEQTN